MEGETEREWTGEKEGKGPDQVSREIDATAKVITERLRRFSILSHGVQLPFH